MIKLENGWQLRLRQEECHNKMLEAYRKGNKEFLLAAVCRFGKTITTLQSLRDLADENNYTSQAIVVLCTMNVKGEWKDAAEKTGFDPRYCETPINEIDFDAIGETGRHVIYVSTQKLGNSSEQSLKLIKWFNRHEGLKTLVYDECHLGSGTARTQREILDRLNFDFKVYLSGTPYRTHLKKEFQFEKEIGQEICYTYSMTDEREDYNNGLITDYTPVKLNMMVLDYQKEIEECVAGEDPDKFTLVYGVSSKYFRKLFSERDMRDQAIEFLEKIVEFAKTKKVTNGLFFVPIRKVGENIVKGFQNIFQNSIEFRSLCQDYSDNSDVSEDEAKLESEAEKINYFFDAPNPSNKIRIAITCNKCGTGTTLRNLDFVAFLKETSNAISFIQQSQRVRTPKEGKEEAYVLCFNQWSALKAFQDYAKTSYPEWNGNEAIKHALDNDAISLTLNMTKEMDYEYIIDLLSYYHPGETLFDDFDINLHLEDFTFITDLERIKDDYAKKNPPLRGQIETAKDKDELKKILRGAGKEKQARELENMTTIKDLHAALTDAYVSQVVEMYKDYGFDLDSIKKYDDYDDEVKANIEAGVCNMDMWKKLNNEYCTYFAKIYNYLKKENLLD